MLKQEWKNLFHNKMMFIACIVILFIPIIYAGIILSSYWDPYGKTQNLPVAVVNNDEPVDFEGKTLNIGEKLINNLKENDDLDWHFVSSKEAHQGFKDEEYYMVITIPEDFSKKASTVLDDEPEKMDLIYEVNPGRNFFGQIISKQALANINTEIAESVTKEYTKAIFSKMDEIAEGFTDAANGAAKIEDGAKQLAQGNTEITENLHKLVTSTLTFQDGAEKVELAVGEFIDGADVLYSGATALNEGITQYTDAVRFIQERASLLTDENQGVPKLVQGQESLNKALKQLADGSTALTNGLNQMNYQLPSQDQLTQLTQGLAGIQSAINQLQQITNQAGLPAQLTAQINALNETVNKVQPATINALNGYSSISTALTSEQGLIQGSSQITAGLNRTVSGSNQLTAATTNLNNQIPQLGIALDQLVLKSAQLRNGSSALVDGTNILSSRLAQLQNGVTQLSDGANQISDGSSKLEQGSGKLGDGILTLKDGANELSEKLTDGAETINETNTTDANYEMFASPTTVTEDAVTDVPNYGHALAPNFLTLGLYIGALAFCLIYPINIASIKPTSGRSWWLSKFSLGFVQSVVGAFILDAVAIFGIGLQVDNFGQFILISILASLTFMFIIMFLAISLGNAGRFLAMIFLVLQLSSSGGMFPVELQSGFFQAINPYMPMTYAIYGFREALTSALGSDIFIQSVLVLTGCIITFNALLLIVLHLQARKQHNVEEGLNEFAQSL